MHNRLHFISGLPRSGSTLLAALFQQNPRFCSGMSSPVYALFRSMLHETSARNEGSVFIDDAIRKRLLTGCSPPTMPRRPRRRCSSTPTGVGQQNCRRWSSFPRRQSDLQRAQSRLDPRQRREPHPPQRLNCRASSAIESGGTVYSRVEGLASAAGMFGFAYNALREAVYGSRTACSSCATKAWSPIRSARSPPSTASLARTFTRMIRATSSPATT